MEALSNSAVFPSRLAEALPSRNPSISALLKFPIFRCGFSRAHESFETLRLSRCEGSDYNGRRRIRALTHEEGELGNGSGLIPDEGSAFLQSNSSDNGSHEVVVSEDLGTITPINDVSGKNGSRAGLFRTPISGGVQSATSAHDLPLPALAVRNLMEQARFAHLCTVMSRMHHRRAGYPFGSLVDFAPDPMGHPIFSLSPLAIHTRNLLADPRCTLVVQIPGWSGLSNARVTIFGDIVPLPDGQQAHNR